MKAGVISNSASVEKIIDGFGIAAELKLHVKLETEGILRDAGVRACLAVIIVGNNHASSVYVKSKHKAAMSVGIESIVVEMPESASEADLLRKIDELNRDDSVHGILVQLPLPSQINSNKVINSISPLKDVDGFHVQNAGLLATGQVGGKMCGIVPCTPLGCLHLLKKSLPKGGLVGVDALVIGSSNIVGKPMANLLLHEKATVTIAHSKTRNLKDICLRSDVVVVATGVRNILRGDMLKNGCTVIDVGINRVVDEFGVEKIVGDADFASCFEVVAKITPVPRGVGPMTIACLMLNTLICIHMQRGNYEKVEELNRRVFL